MQKEALLKNMTDQVMEAQLKLGYAQETVRLYYPTASLNVLLGTDFTDAEELCKCLAEAFGEDCCLGRLHFHVRSGGRIEVGIPPEGSMWVHDTLPVPAFLAELIGLFQKKPACTLEEIEAVFVRQGSAYQCERMPEGTGFDYVLHFADSAVDAYYYCIHMEMGHTIYHRFTEPDYRALL